MSTTTLTVDAVREVLIKTLSEELGIAPEEVVTDRNFANYGVDSMTAMTVATELEDALGIDEIPPTLLWDCPTVDTLAPALQRAAAGETPFPGHAAS